MAARAKRAAKAAPAGVQQEARPEGTDGDSPPAALRPVESEAERKRLALVTAAIKRAIEEACEYLAFVNPTIATLVPTVPQRPDARAPAPAYATASACYYGPVFLQFSLREQAAVVMHEYAHVALGHNDRRQTIARIAGSVMAKLLNIAADLVINTWIDEISRRNRDEIALPKGLVTISSIDAALRQAKVEYSMSPTAARHQVTSTEGLATHSTETIYTILGELREKMPPIDGGAMGDDLSEVELDEHGRVVVRSQEEKDEIAKRIAHSVGTMAGSDSWNFVSNIMKRLPRASINWRRQLRDVLIRHASEETEATWRRRSRRQASMPADAGPLQGNRRCETGDIAAIIDTSGSVPDTVIVRFMAECLGVANMIGKSITVIEADVEVKRISQMAPGGSPVRPMMDAGRGGTDFTEALKKAASLNPSVIVYLTDLCAAEPGYKPKMPTIWCSSSDVEPPSFGRVIRIKDEHLG